jgi:Reverse transcriptase (RNA-dependent DNA polymerase)
MEPPGGPPEWASFLIQLDIEGTTSVRLPVSQFAHDKAGQAGLSRLQALGATDVLFPAERGVSQGDVASPFGWNAVCDILLRALTIKRHHIMDSATQAIAYADDLFSVSSTITSLQQQADLVAAFAAIFELDLAHTKLRGYEFPYHRIHARQPSTPPLILKVNGTDIPLRQTETLMYLGSQSKRAVTI